MQNRAGATAEEKAEYQVGLAREVARNERAAQGYVGTLKMCIRDRHKAP